MSYPQVRHRIRQLQALLKDEKLSKRKRKHLEEELRQLIAECPENEKPTWPAPCSDFEEPT